MYIYIYTYIRTKAYILFVFFFLVPAITMKYFVLICVIAMTLFMIVHSEKKNNINRKSFELTRRDVEDDHRYEDSHEEVIERVRRQSSRCEPCGVRRLPCCFPNLCQHRSSKISKCLKVNG
ncbi:hypothetical protein I4U23_009100 [Adineta vaga]|nr:hypothetical protein I4U23_009100 [Adineta vaga]